MAKANGKKATGKAVAKSGGARARLPANWEEQLLKDAEDEAAITPTSEGNTIRLRKNLKMSLRGEDIGTSVNAVVVAASFLNAWYDSPFDENNPSPPACFALAMREDGIAPHDSSPDKQAKMCSECEFNEFGSRIPDGTLHGGKSKAKECSNRRKLALLLEDDLPAAEAAEFTMLGVPATSLSAYHNWVKLVSKTGRRPTYAVLVTIELDQEIDTQTLKFSTVRPLEDDELAAVMARLDQAREKVMEPIDVSGYQPPPKGGKQARGQRQAAAPAPQKGGARRSRFA